MNLKIEFIFLVIMVSICCTGCTGQMFVIKPEGDQAIITMHSDAEITAELLAINDDVLYVNILSGNQTIGINQQETLIGLSLDEIRNIEIMGYRNNHWVGPWIALQLLPPIVLGLTASSVEGNDLSDGVVVWAIYSIPAVASGIAMRKGSPKNPSISSNFSSVIRTEINKYVRYPLGLNSEQLSKIAKANGQSEYRVLQFRNEN